MTPSDLAERAADGRRECGTPDPHARVSSAGKRVLDVTGALIGLAMSAPVMLLIALLVRLDSRGPVFHRQLRVGRAGARFRMYKIRTMHVDADDLVERRLERDPVSALSWHEFQKLYDDPRITRAGRVLRRWSLDELPQLVNVLRGEMSLVGPRPILPTQRDVYGPALREYVRVRPGLTGLWQVSGRNRLSFSERVALDRAYIANRTTRRDLGILLRTVFAVLRRDGAY